MVAAVDEEKTREYIRTLEGFISNGAKLLGSARRWPWKRHDVPRLLNEVGHDFVVLGINQYAVGESARGCVSFARAAECASERLRGLREVFLGHQDVQFIAAAVIAEAWSEARAIADLGLDSSRGSHQNTQVVAANAGARSLLKWVIKTPADWAETETVTTSTATMQFTLWGEAARRGRQADVAGLQAAVVTLADFVRREVRSGEFRYSEDRIAYLPGVLILRLAERDGLTVTAPTDPWWQI